MRMAQYIDELDYRARSRIAKNLAQVGIKTHPAKAGDAYARKLEKIINDAVQGKGNIFSLLLNEIYTIKL